MIIKTLTCHDVYNYGASLQAYALMKLLQSYGHDVEIIEYKPEYMCDDYNFWVLPQYAREKKYVQRSKILHFIYCLYLSKSKFATWKRIKPFKKFKKDYLSCTQVYKSYNQLKSNYPPADLYIAGSDQIWNTNLTIGNDPAFYLNFGTDSIRKISYAASFALSDIPEEKIHRIAHYLKALDDISVREKTGLTLLKKMGFDGITVMDPVFLLPKEQWKKMAGNVPLIDENYVFVYDLYTTELDIPKLSKEIADKSNCKILVVNGKLPIKYGNIIIKNAGPIEFLNYLVNANYVVTDSFHAAAFSIIFNISFSVFNHKENKSRLIDLLENISLVNRLNNINSVEDKVDWDNVNYSTTNLVNNSLKFLLRNINIR